MKFIALIASVLGLGLAAPAVANACSCAPSTDVGAAAAEADAVFLAEAVGVTRVLKSSPATLEYTFEIKQSWKGPRGRTVVRSLEDSAACGRAFSEGAEYLVYASEVDGVLTDTACSRTAPSHEATGDIEVLNQKEDAPGVDGPKTAVATTRGLPGGPASIASAPNHDVVTSQCNVIAEGELSAEQLVQILTETGPYGFVCARSLVVLGNVHLDVEGLRLVGLELGDLQIQGNLLIGRPTVLMGAEVTGTVLLSERAAGSVLVGNAFKSDMLAATAHLIGVGNQCQTQCTAPGRTLELGLHVPDAATGVLQQVPTAQVAEVPRDDEGNFIGFYQPETAYRPRYEDTPELKTVDLGDLSNEWPPPVCEADTGCGHVPVYGNLKPTDTQWGIFVPLETGRWRQPGLGFIYVP